MKKRAILSVGASMAAVLLTSGSVFAAEGLDYAKSLGQVDMGDTVNYVIEATSDGGYVAGGQTIQCFKIVYDERGGRATDGSWLLEHGEVAPMEECFEYMSQEAPSRGDADDESYTINFYDYCENPREHINVYNGNAIGGRSDVSLSVAEPEAPVVRLADYDDSAYYGFSCVDYIAKFKQDGTKEWLSTIKDNNIPVAVGETNSDYRLLTQRGTLYTFAKTSGDEGLSSQFDVDVINDAIINKNGTTTVAIDGTFGLIGANGQVSKILENHSSEDGVDFYGGELAETEVSKPLVRSDDGFITVHLVQERHVDEETGDVSYTGTYSIVEISTDLNTVTPIVESSMEEILESGEAMVPMSADQDGNIVVLVEDIEGGSAPYIASVNKDGEVVATKTLDEFFGTIDENEPENLPLVLDNFIVVNPADKSLMHFSPQLEVTNTYNLSEGEMVYDAVSLTDGSTAAVGRASASTDNYTVDGGMNGTYLRIITAKASGNGANPNTDDEVAAYLVGGGIIVTIATGVALLIGKRR